MRILRNALLLVPLLLAACSANGPGQSPTATQGSAGSTGPVGTWMSSTSVSLVVVTNCTRCGNGTFDQPYGRDTPLCTDVAATATWPTQVEVDVSPGSDAGHVDVTVFFHTSGSTASMLRDCGITHDNANPASGADFFGGANLSYHLTGTVGSATFLGLLGPGGTPVGSFQRSGNSMTGSFTGFTHTAGVDVGTNPVYHTEPGSFTVNLQP